ncbi:hypothetical protein PUNSTDRAFT_137188 [Punctularia strigosozonata HHB-11173 SS5]|uniref:uncharacterized protein n=1 Tax=Punctularia strigosozonata (strain HHB-11173) TaxID=741275 RepID=UPI000441693F|nr:uncharacterized protein PUNSTDRAFT_137188 [Punctularia strigosozonata HHB-11173 SS5]EIN05695.1 hypothetical protein PUNSTDRAFT_137188 [Punctularia strigosozonata HHB-11173 SS5]
MDPLPLSVRHIVDVLESVRLPTWVQMQDPSSFCEQTRDFYMNHICYADGSMFAQEECFSSEEHELLRSMFALVLRQSMAVRGYRKNDDDRRIVLPEVLVMLSIILRKCFPRETHEHCDSVMFAVSKSPAGTDEQAAPALRLRAELVIRRINNPTQIDPNSTSPARDAHTPEVASGSFVEDRSGDRDDMSGVTQYGYAQQLLYSRSPVPQGPTDVCVANACTIHPLLTIRLYTHISPGSKKPPKKAVIW